MEAIRWIYLFAEVAPAALLMVGGLGVVVRDVYLRRRNYLQSKRARALTKAGV